MRLVSSYHFWTLIATPTQSHWLECECYPHLHKNLPSQLKICKSKYFPLPLSSLSWVSDVALTHPVVWSTALCFFHSSSLHKVRHQGSFLLLLTRRHDYQVWQWSPEPLQWAWHVTSTEAIEVSLKFFFALND